jgi:N-acetyl-anhydromuramyl-L-alanine amidase AmpD
MVIKPVQLWQRFSWIAGLFVTGMVVGVTLYEQSHPVNGSPFRGIVPKTVGVSEVQSSSSPEKSPAEQQLVELYRLYQAAPKLSIDELIDHEASSPEDDASMRIASLQVPAQYRIDGHPSNFGDRRSRDIQGRSVQNKLLIVLHETTSAASGAVNTVLTPHSYEEDQISYHAVICQDGTILYLVDPRKRAYGAGHSAFKGRHGFEKVQTNKRLKPSVNNFAYHISLETPQDGYNSDPKHNGYSGAQYNSLAWLIAHSGVTDNRITTHFAIDQSGERQDPRSFEMSWLQHDLALQNIDSVSQSATP